MVISNISIAPALENGPKFISGHQSQVDAECIDSMKSDEFTTAELVVVTADSSGVTQRTNHGN